MEAIGKELWVWKMWDKLSVKADLRYLLKLVLLFNCQVVFDSSQPQGLQHTRLPCPSPSPRVCPSSCLLNQWCHPTISSSVIFCQLLFLLPSVFSSIRVFSNELAIRIRWLEYWLIKQSTQLFRQSHFSFWRNGQIISLFTSQC